MTFGSICGIILLSVGERLQDLNRKKISKIFEKPLDKSLKMWYNISVKGRETKTSTNRGVGKVIQWTL